MRRVACYSDDMVRASSENTCASSSVEMRELTCAVIWFGVSGPQEAAMVAVAAARLSSCWSNRRAAAECSAAAMAASRPAACATVALLSL